MFSIADRDIGGAHVMRVFSSNGVPVKAGGHLTADEVIAIPIANRRALVDAGYLAVYPKGAVPQQPKAERFVIATGKDKYGVISGHQLHDKPLTREQAEHLAHGGEQP
jgi:hypothetical protein